MGLVEYGSGSENSDDEETPIAKAPQKAEEKPKQPAKRPPKKIAIALPALSKRPQDDGEDDQKDGPAEKKPRLGAGRSSLLGMLPTPKQTKPIQPQQPQRVLGGGSGPGLVFNTSRPAQSSETYDAPTPSEAQDEEPEQDEPMADPAPSRSSLLLPPSLQKRRPNVSLEETPTVRAPPKPAVSSAPAIDFFSLGAATKSSAPAVASSSSSTLPSIPSASAAPSIPEFKPPEPTPYDAYPGYYQLPSGAWAQHDVGYYNQFAAKWKREYDAHVRALEKGKAKGFEDLDESNMQEIDPVEEMERAKKEVQEREERKALTKGAGAGPAEPKMKMTAAKMSGVARSRHQLATLLKDAYENREVLEEKIAQGRRNRKEAGNKYGPLHLSFYSVPVLNTFAGF
ncbi:mitotic checkpoint regulator, MAD2B-interacting-domain-containing protein [Coprinopsis sp. MPI-PUGE-AT-0042]|nr:mitotic checkpoint regulator, MAD2B-interacting-domain-containing protein [Coprinopsis sp. MPI-PUGE-AT-0042]